MLHTQYRIDSSHQSHIIVLPVSKWLIIFIWMIIMTILAVCHNTSIQEIIHQYFLEILKRFGQENIYSVIYTVINALSIVLSGG